jgi:hypothetical protein
MHKRRRIARNISGTRVSTAQALNALHHSMRLSDHRVITYKPPRPIVKKLGSATFLSLLTDSWLQFLTFLASVARRVETIVMVCLCNHTNNTRAADLDDLAIPACCVPWKALGLLRKIH